MEKINIKELKRKRALYLQQRLKDVKKIHRIHIIYRLANELFISVDTIYRDLRIKL